MSDPTLQAQIDAANAYEALFVPALFAQWAPKVADAAQLKPDQRVLDVACGTGILAREAILRVGLKGRVAGVDPIPGMVAVARQLEPAVEWREEARVASTEITTHHGTAEFPSIRTMVEADLRGWLPVMGVILTEDQIGRVLQQADHALSSYATADGRVSFRVSAHLATAKKRS
jgi:SAM-dependent methyltransferase